jgi:hypothetical protein
MESWVTVSEAATQSTYSREHITYLVRKGFIKGRRSGAIWLVNLESLKDYETRMAELGSAKHTPKHHEE